MRIKRKLKDLLLKYLPIVRILFLIPVVFATTAIYIYGQNIHSTANWIEAIRMQALITWVFIGGALVVIILYVCLEVWAHRQEDKEKLKVSDKLDVLIESQRELNTKIGGLIKRIDERWPK